MRKRYKLTVAAEMLGVNPWTVRRWVYSGKAPALKTEKRRGGQKTKAAIKALEETE